MLEHTRFPTPDNSRPGLETSSIVRQTERDEEEAARDMEVELAIALQEEGYAVWQA